MAVSARRNAYLQRDSGSLRRDADSGRKLPCRFCATDSAIFNFWRLHIWNIQSFQNTGYGIFHFSWFQWFEFPVELETRKLWNLPNPWYGSVASAERRLATKIAVPPWQGADPEISKLRRLHIWKFQSFQNTDYGNCNVSKLQCV